jgi:hypothetical protein
MFLLVSIPIGLSLGLVTWSLIRGRGGLAGLALCMAFGAISAFVGGLAGLAIFGTSSASIGLGSCAGALVMAIVAAAGWGPRPKHEIGPRGSHSGVP